MALDPPPGLYLNDNRQAGITASMFVTWVLAFISVSLRFIARKLAKAGFWVDDWLMIPALTICTLLTFVAGIWQIQHGLGKHIYILANPARSATVMLQALFIAELCYTGAVICVKGSILALYWRLFKLKVKVPAYIVGTMVLCWGIAVFLITVLQCFPLRGFWDKSIAARCGVDDYKFFYGNSIPNIITDFALLGLPLPCIWKLKVQRSQKFILSGMFTLGGFVVAVGIVRLKVLLDINAVSPDITWSLWPSQLWTTIELNVAVVSGCLPSLRPILNLVHARYSTNTATPSSGDLQDTAHGPRLLPWSQKNGAVISSGGNDRRAFNRLSDNTVRQLGEPEDYQLHSLGESARSINVHDRIQVEWEDV